MSGECYFCGEHGLECKCKEADKKMKKISQPWKITSQILPRYFIKVLVTDGYIYGLAEIRPDPDKKDFWLHYTSYEIDPIFWRFLPDLPESLPERDKDLGSREDL